MAEVIPVPMPEETWMQYFMRNPDALRQAIMTLNQVVNIEAQLVAGTTDVQGRSPAVLSQTNIILPIPVKFPNKIPVVVTTGTTATDLASVIATMNNLLGALTLANINPP
jgi:hypothetical protein